MAKKTKITKAIANKLAGAILSASLPGLLARLGAELYVLVKEVREEIYTPEAVAALKAVPKNFGLLEVDEIRVKLDNNTTLTLPLCADLKSAGSYNGWHNYQLTDTANRQCEAEWSKGNRPYNSPILVPSFNKGRIFQIHDESLLERLKAWYKVRQTLTDNGVADSLAKVARTLQTFTYIEDLETAWPEVWDMAQQFLPENIPVVALPTTSTRSLNEVLGLPVAA